MSLLLLMVTTTSAEKLRILFLNYPHVWINGKPMKEGDMFELNQNTVIIWEKDKQAMKVLDIDTFKRYLIVANPAMGKKESGLEILTRIKRLSTEDESDDHNLVSFEQLERIIQKEYYLMDSIAIPTPITVNEHNYFRCSYKYGDTWISKRLKHENGMIIIDKSIFNVDNKIIPPRDIFLSIEYVVKTSVNPIAIKGNVKITIIPEKIE